VVHQLPTQEAVAEEVISLALEQAEAVVVVQVAQQVVQQVQPQQQTRVVVVVVVAKVKAAETVARA